MVGGRFRAGPGAGPDRRPIRPVTATGAGLAQARRWAGAGTGGRGREGPGGTWGAPNPLSLLRPVDRRVGGTTTAKSRSAIRFA